MKGLANGADEIHLGPSAPLPAMSRLAPGFIHRTSTRRRTMRHWADGWLFPGESANERVCWPLENSDDGPAPGEDRRGMGRLCRTLLHIEDPGDAEAVGQHAVGG